MKKERPSIAGPAMLCLAAALMLVASVASAQDTQSAKPDALRQGAEEMVAEDEEPFYETLQVGDATQGLLAWQRSGDVASPTPRAIAGAVANRSYERYLKSFEFAIPERLGSTVKSSNSAGAAR